MMFASASPIQWAILATLITAAFTALGVWLKTRPDSRRAETEAKALNLSEMTAVIADYAKRQAETRLEVHGYRNEVMALRSELQQMTQKSMRRGDKLNTVLFILGMVMDRLHEKDPNDKVLANARTLLDRVQAEDDGSIHDPNKSTAMNTAEGAVADAKATLASTKATCEEVKHSEEGGGK